MSRDKSRDYIKFHCKEESELRYVANLYNNYSKVYTCLTLACMNNKMEDLTYMQVYQLIKTELGCEIPE